MDDPYRGFNFVALYYVYVLLIEYDSATERMQKSLAYD